MNIHPWILLVTAAIEMARKLGHEPPGADALEQAWSELNAAAGKLLPAEITALTFLAQRNAAAAIAKIDTMPMDPTCPQCGKVVRRWISFNPTTRARTERSACDDVACGWRS